MSRVDQDEFSAEFRLSKARQHAAENRWRDVIPLLRGASAEVWTQPEAVYLFAEACTRTGELAQAQDSVARCLALFRAANDSDGILRASTLFGIVLFRSGDLDGARQQFHAALQLAEDAEDLQRQARLWNNLGSCADLQEELEEAKRCFGRALDLYRMLGEVLGQAQTLYNLGITYRNLSKPAEADDCFAQAVELARALADQELVGDILNERARLALAAGNLQGAEAMARAALIRFELQGSVSNRADAFALMAAARRRRGDLLESRALLDRALEACQIFGSPLVEAEVRLERGHLAQDEGNRVAAREEFALAASAFAALGRHRQAEEARSFAAAALGLEVRERTAV